MIVSVIITLVLTFVISKLLADGGRTMTSSLSNAFRTWAISGSAIVGLAIGTIAAAFDLVPSWAIFCYTVGAAALSLAIVQYTYIRR